MYRMSENMEQQEKDLNMDESENNHEQVEADRTAENSLVLQLEEKTRQCDEYLSALQRAAAEFDNFRKRTAREKEGLYADTVCEVLTKFLPILDNMERALLVSEEDSSKNSFREGVEMIFRQLGDVLKAFGVETIESIGKEFDPELHNAVMHIEDEDHGASQVVEEFQKGYKLKDKVLRHSMVKVAN